MGILDGWREDRRRLRDLSKDAIANIDRFDQEDAEGIREEMRDYRVAEHKLSDLSETGPWLATDTLHALRKVNPKVLPTHAMRPTFVVDQMVATQLARSPEYERLKPWTEGDLVNSALAFVTLSEDLAKFLDKAKKFKEQAEELERKMAEMLENDERLSDLDELQQELQDQIADQEALDELMKAIEEIRQQLEQEGADLDQLIEELADSFESDANATVRACMPDLRQGLRQAAEEASNLQSMMSTYGSDPGEMQKMSAVERIRLAERLASQPNFKFFADMIGMMQRVAMAEQRRKMNGAREEIYDVGLGNDIERILPEELAGLTIPVMKLDFYRRFVEGRLMQYEMRGEEKLQKGGFVVVMDNSGSMAGVKERWAKGCGGGTMMIARDQKRSFYGIHFASTREIKHFDFRDPDDMTIDGILDYYEHFFNGGTDFSPPLALALKILQDEEQAKGTVEGDIIFITDGDGPLDANLVKTFNQEKERMGFRLWALLIGYNSSVIGQVADHIITVNDLMSANDIRDMFGQL